MALKTTTDFADPAVQAACPYCGSKDVTTSPKRTPESYWRCVACGSVWHPERLASRSGAWRQR